MLKIFSLDIETSYKPIDIFFKKGRYWLIKNNKINKSHKIDNTFFKRPIFFSIKNF